MSERTLLDALAATRVVAILRGHDAGRMAQTARALAGAGVRCIEVALNTTGALAALRGLAADPPVGALLGAGTVLDPGDARNAVAGGARYLITPNVDVDVIAAGRSLGVPVIPGAFTPTEIAAARRAGAAAVKVFPAGTGGPGYLRAVRAPLRDIPLVATGGIELDAASAYVAAGALGVGMGRPLIGDALEGGSLDALADRARRLLAALEEPR
jgi:2-dehydro-3-deoxyphosphogluconate aldolase/(4S)-4-hydroxy-2-oxoglutarate aldolase